MLIAQVLNNGKSIT